MLGLQHKNALVRAKVAFFLEQVVDRMGPSITSCKDFEKAFQAISQLTTEGNAEARSAYYNSLLLAYPFVLVHQCENDSSHHRRSNGKKALYTLFLGIGDSAFDQKGRKILGESGFSAAKTIVEKMARNQTKGGAVLVGDFKAKRNASTPLGNE